MLVALLGCSSGNASSDATRPAKHATRSVVALGRLEPATRLISLGGPADDRIEKLLVNAGDRVEPGAVLAETKAHAVRAAELQAAERRLAEAEKRKAAEGREGDALLEKAQLAAQRAKLERLGADGQRAHVSGLEARLAHARADAERVGALKARGATSTQAMERAAMQLREEEAELAMARAKLDQLEAGAALSDRESENAVRLAQAQVARAESAVPVDSLRAEVDLARARVEQTVIRAPVAGRILKVHVLPGETIGARSVIDMGDVDHMYAVAQVFETEVALLETGQSAEITSGALPAPVKGVVEEIGFLVFKKDVLGDDPRAPRDSRVFEVRIKLEPSEALSRLTNHEVEARIDVAAAQSP